MYESYERIVNSLRYCMRLEEPAFECIEMDGGCCDSIGRCIPHLMDEAADAIETLYAAYTESFSVIAKAFRNNPKNLVLREYMMKNACCCEVEEGE